MEAEVEAGVGAILAGGGAGLTLDAGVVDAGMVGCGVTDEEGEGVEVALCGVLCAI